MRILSIGTSLFAAFWRDAGHSVCVATDRDNTAHPDTVPFDFFVSPQKAEVRLRQLVETFRPEVTFQGDHSTPLIHCGLETIDLPKAWYAIDTHLHHAWHRYYAAPFDMVFCAQKNMVPVLRTHQPVVEWLPLFCQRSSAFLPWEQRTVDVAFVGKVDPSTNAERVSLFNALEQKGVRLYKATGDYVPVYCSSRIVVNQSVADDLNFRFFEAPGCGALLVTDRLSHSMGDILKEGTDFLAYEQNNADDCADKIRWALAHSAEADTMARSAHGKISASHMVKNRAATVLNCLERLAAAAHDGATIAAYNSWVHCYCSRLKLPQHLTAFFAARAEKLALAGRDSEAGRPYSLLVLAEHALENGKPLPARSLLLQITELPQDREFRLRYYHVTIEAEIGSGNINEANRCLSLAKNEFPEHEEFNVLGKKLPR
jgi:hypothetical protein